MSRKLFCDINPTCYQISLKKEYLIRDLKNIFSIKKIAKKKTDIILPNIVKSHCSILLRKLYGVDMKLQRNKITNIEIACDSINKIIIHPKEIFSFWSLVGIPNKQRGFKEGLTIGRNGFVPGYGGGLCQMANMIHWLILNSPLKVIELHHHTDALFPDDRRRVPFGTGTSVFYKNIDYRFENTTKQDIQILVWIENGQLCGELRSEQPFPYRYKLVEENHHYEKEKDTYYRVSNIYRITIERKTNKEIKKELILANHSEVMYDYALIPKEEIKQ